MNLFRKLKTGIASASLLCAAQLATAGSFDNVNSNGQSFGKMSKNVSNSMIDGATAFEAFLYVLGIFCVVMFILTLIKWKKSEGREGSAGMMAVWLLAGVFAIAAPTVMGGGITTLFGSGTVQTVKAPSASVVGN